MKPNSAFWRLAIAFALLIALTVGVGLIGLHEISNICAGTTEFLEKRYAILLASQEALSYSSINTRLTMQVFITPDTNNVKTLLAARAKNSEKIQALASAIQSQLTSAEEKNLLAQVLQKRISYRSSYSHVTDLVVKQSRIEEARAIFLEETTPLLIDYHEAWHSFIQFQAEATHKADHEARASLFSTRRLLIWMLAVTILLAVAIAATATRAIGKEIATRQEMQNSLREASEQLEARVGRRTLELSRLNRELMVEIEQRKQAEEALRESEAKYRSIFEGSNDAIMLLSNRTFCDCNPKTLEMFGFSRKGEFLNLSPAMISPPLQPDGEDSNTSAENQIKIAFSKGFNRFEWFHRRANGEEFPTEVSLFSFQLAGEQLIHATVHDISVRKKMEATLAQERAQFQNLMEYMPDTIYFKDRQSRFTLVNPAFAQWLGQSSPADFVGKTDFDIFGQKHSHQTFNDEQQLMETGIPIVGLEEKEDRTDGSTTWVSTTKVPIRDQQGKITGLVGISRDVTAHKGVEEALRDSAYKYQNLIESVSDWVWEADDSVRYVYSNPQVTNVLGYRIDQIIGLSICDLMPGVEQDRIMGLFEKVVREGKHEFAFDCFCLHKNGDAVRLEVNVCVITDVLGTAHGFRGVARDVTERRRFEEDLRILSRALDQSPVSVVITDTVGRIEYVNANFCEVTGYTAQELRGKNPKVLKSGVNRDETYQQLWQAITKGNEWRGELCNRKKNGELFWESIVISPIKKEDGVISHYLGVKEDITERRRLQKEREAMDLQLRQAQKLESVGQLAAGIAHEINTPVQYVGDNLRFIQDSFAAVNKVLVGYEALTAKISPGTLDPQAFTDIEAIKSDSDIAYVCTEVPSAIQQSLDGVQRIAEIVRAMKEFSHPGGKEKIEVDINHAIQTTITVARNEWKYVAKVVTNFATDLPRVPCFPDEFNQVILNLLVNAAHTIGDVVKKVEGSMGTIAITTKKDGLWAEIRVSDTGTGIPEEIRHRIFELFFTTKEVGKGTGQGLALARAVIVKKHGGELTFESAVGQGTTFIIRLPLTVPTTS